MNKFTVQNLNLYYGAFQALKNVGMEIPEKEITAFIGPSGCGKSTFLRCLNCLELMDSGSVTVAGVTVARAPGQTPDDEMLQKVHELRTEVGMVFQGYNLFPNKTLVQNVMLAPMVVKKMNKLDAHDLAMQMLSKVGLDSYANKYPSTVSGGQSQRAAIARALAMNPRVMLYDEPTSALDPELVGEVLQVMKELDAEGMTQVIVTHEMKFAKDASDYIIFMDKGEIVEYEDGDILFANPKYERTRSFLRHFVNAGVTC